MRFMLRNKCAQPRNFVISTRQPRHKHPMLTRSLCFACCAAFACLSSSRRSEPRTSAQYIPLDSPRSCIARVGLLLRFQVACHNAIRSQACICSGTLSQETLFCLITCRSFPLEFLAT